MMIFDKLCCNIRKDDKNNESNRCIATHVRSENQKI